MVTHTQNSCSAFTHPSAHTAVNTHTHTHTHTVNTHPEQWAAIYPAAPWEQLEIWCLAQGHLVVVLKVERALYIHSPHQCRERHMCFVPTIYQNLIVDQQRQQQMGSGAIFPQCPDPRHIPSDGRFSEVKGAALQKVIEMFAA